MGRVVQKDELVKLREQWKNQGKKIVFTNGCFDIVHRGHIEYLAKAKSLGDILIVGVNTDASTRRIKGEQRPIIGEDDRAFIVANLSPVDYTCLFDEDTPYELIQSVVPNILVKGADWNVGDIIGKDIVENSGGKVMAIEFSPNRSTTSIIERIIERFNNS
jgi:rfaE bifunctional protein nucleotidyltransferase chain/domain